MDDAITATRIFDEFDPDSEDFHLNIASALLDAREENARLMAELQEAQYMNGKLTEQADAFSEENGRLREQLRKAHITTVARPFPDNDLDCEGDGSGPGCEHAVMWEIQAMDASGSHYSYVCSDHLDSYQKWAAEDGRQSLVFEAD